MQMGVRWAVGSPPHRSAPPALHEAIANVEAETPSPLGSWTLTWLEGLPRLALDGELRLTLDHAGQPVYVAHGDDAISAETLESTETEDDDWLN